MQLTFHCPLCGHPNRTGDVTAGSALQCRQCSWGRPVDTTEPLTQCAVCGNSDLWRQKDFPQGLGLMLVVAGALLSSVAWYLHWPRTAIGLLMAFALVDMVLFALMPDVLVCYRCKARHHNSANADAHQTFSHETAERYRQEQLRVRESQHSRSA